MDTVSTEKNWKSIYFEDCYKNGYSEEEAEMLYLCDMERQAFFDFSEIMPRSLKLQNKTRDEYGLKELRYYWKSHSQEAKCPFCSTISYQQCNDYFTKPVQDIPRDCLTVYHEVTFKKYFCKNEGCKYTRFVERFPEFSEEDARKTVRLIKHFINRAAGCGCNHAEEQLRAEGAVVSHDMLMEYLKKEGARQIEENLNKSDIKVLAIDDINLRKGDKKSGCTVFIDAETHKTLIIIRATTKEAVKKVIDKFHSVEFLSSDRANSYSAVGKECKKTQVADRFHLIKNAQDAVSDALMAEIPAQIFIRNGDGWIQETQEEDEVLKPFFYVPDEIVEGKIKLAELSKPKADTYRNTLKMLELTDKGKKSADIARELGLSVDDVRKLRRKAVSTIENVRNGIAKNLERVKCNTEIAEIVTEKVPGSRAIKTVSGPRVKPARESIVEPYRETVIELWKTGGNHRTILPVIAKQGYTGCANTIYQYLLKLGKEEPENMIREIKKKCNPEPLEEEFDIELAKSMPDLSLEYISRDTVYKSILKEASETRPKSAKEAAPKAKRKPKTYENSRSPYSKEIWELIHGAELKEKKQLSEEDREKEIQKKNNMIDKVKSTYTVVPYLTEFLSDCYHVFDTAQIEELDKFIIKYKDSKHTSIAKYAKSLLADYDAVRNSIIYLNISNGPLEGHNSRIKFKHRRSGGRAGLDLLNAYFVLSSYTFVELYYYTYHRLPV